MSVQQSTLTDDLTKFLSSYYRDEIGELAQHYPNEQRSLYVEYDDLYRYDPEVADDLLDQPDTVHEYLDEALRQVDLPVDVKLNKAEVRITDTEGALDRHSVDEVMASEFIGRYVAIRAQIGQVTGKMSRITEGAFECQRCGTMTYIPQGFTEFQQPHECQGCERQGPFRVDYQQSEFVDQRKVRFEQPPEEQLNGSGDDIIGYCLRDLVDVGGAHGLQDRAGSRVTVLGTVEVDDSELYGRGTNEPVVDKYFVPKAFVFDDNDDDELDVNEHREEVNEFASRPDAIDVFRKSIDPGLTITEKWDVATQMATAWLFAAPRIDPEGGDMVRGDLHMLFVSDPGMRKSVFAKCLAELSPQCELRQATGMSSDVGLTSAAQQDDFGGGEWTLKPGALPRANGGHLILDEIDKGPGLGGIHDALEGSQELKVDKAGIQATLATRVGFLALGNPVEGRFDPYQDIADQIDLDPALMSRFDLIVTMQDKPDQETDENIASGVLESIDESSRLQYGTLETEDADHVTPDVPRKVMQAWVKIAREEVNPLLTEDAKDILRDFYVDTRQLNGDDSEATPATARTLVGGTRIAMAFARCELSETVEERHAQRAVSLSRTVVGENWDPVTGEFDADRTTETPSSQKDRIERIESVLRNADEKLSTEEVADKAGINTDLARGQLESLKNKSKTNIIEPVSGQWRWV